MNQDRVEFNTTKSDGYDNIPVLQFLPPTDEPSSFALAISVTLVGCLIVAICGNVSQMVLQLKLIHKDKIDGEHYIMLIHTYQCLLSPGSNLATQVMRFGFEFVAPLSISIYLHGQLRSNNEPKYRIAIMRNLSTGMEVLDKQADLKQLLAFLSPTLLWHPLGQLSGVLSRCFGQNRRRSTTFSNSRKTDSGI
ncbi:unnamed protein product [Angiostrongylus costaricensis]|uniref:G protein-coupled receptor n=1 Tax=Angiostrongylus costaricensis TaxID=334426 RepID=A0A0R3PV52_ANGCS|nr:unnamed protein product [Angiostrongylus costaricensis]